MRRGDQRIRKYIDALGKEIGEADERVMTVLREDTDQAVAQFATTMLADETIDTRVATKVLWLLPLFPSDEFVAVTIETLRTRPALARASAAALSEVKDLSCVPEVTRVLEDTGLASESRAAAVSVLAQLDESKCQQICERLIQNGSEGSLVLSTAARALGHMPTSRHSEVVMGNLAKLLTSRSPDVRYSVLVALGNLTAERSLPAIAPLLDDKAVTADGLRVDEEAARVIRRLVGSPEPMSEGLRASVGGDEDDWHRLREFFEKLQRDGAVVTARRFENVQFMSGATIRALCLSML